MSQKHCRQRSGLAAGLETGNFRPVQMPICIFKVEGKDKKPNRLRPPEQKLNGEQKVQVYFRPPALRQTGVRQPSSNIFFILFQ